ncbi:tripartite tricarboxylate transporter TctB family protein [Mailhella sp.]|uniref:tripartite tricarboxylate transporter TctB family protein n=1 Tax=Mailhella sp. TaxID=1981029 RepID=UPI003AB222F9
MNSRFNIDTLGGLSILAIVAFFFLQLGDDFTPFGLFFPERILPILTLLGALILAKGLLRSSGNLKGVFQINKTMVISMVTGAAWALLLVPVGFILASFLSMFFLLMIYIPKGERTLKRALTNGVGSLICVLFFYYVFVQFLGVTLPDGSLFMD